MNWWHVVATPIKGDKSPFTGLPLSSPNESENFSQSQIQPVFEMSQGLYHSLSPSSIEKEMEVSVNSLHSSALVEASFLSKSANFLLNTLVMISKGEDAT